MKLGFSLVTLIFSFSLFASETLFVGKGTLDFDRYGEQAREGICRLMIVDDLESHQTRIEFFFDKKNLLSAKFQNDREANLYTFIPETTGERKTGKLILNKDLFQAVVHTYIDDFIGYTNIHMLQNEGGQQILTGSFWDLSYDAPADIHCEFTRR